MGIALLEEAAEEAEEEVVSSMSAALIVAIIIAVLVVAGGIAIAIKIPSKNTPVTRIIYCSVSVIVSVGALIMGVFGNREHAIGEDVFFVIMLGLFAFALIWLQPKTFIYNLLLDIVLGLVLTIASVFIAQYDYGWVPGLLMVVISFICMGYHIRRLIKRNRYIRYQEDKLAQQEAAQAQQAAPRNKRELKQAIMNSTPRPSDPADGSASVPLTQAGQDVPAVAEPAEEKKTDSKEDGEDNGLDLDIDPFDL